MNRQFLIAILLLLSFQSAWELIAQNSRTLFYDSLRAELSNPRMNIDRVSMLGELAYHLRSSKPDSSMLLAREALSLAHTLDKDRIDNIFRIIALAHYYQKDADSALWYFEQSKAIASETGDMETLSNCLNDLGVFYKIQEEPEKALIYFQESLKIKTETKDKTGRISAIINIGNTHLDIGNYEKADTYYQEAFDILKDGEGKKNVQAVILANMGLVASHQGKKEKTLNLFQMALALNQELGAKKAESALLAKIALVHMEQGRFSEALDNYLQSLEIRQELGNEGLISSSYFSLGNLYKENNDFATALTYYQKALVISQKIKDDQLHANTLNALGNIYRLEGACLKALPFYFRALQLRENMGQKQRKSIPLCNIGICYEQLNKLDSALIYLKKALLYSKESRIEDIKISTHIALGKVYEKKKKNKLAIIHLEEALTFSSYLGFNKRRYEVLEILYQTHKDQANYQQALKYLEQYKVLQDSLFNEENTRELIRVESRFKFEKEKQEQAAEIMQVNSALEKEKLLQRIFMIGLIVVFVLLLTAYRYYQLKRRANITLLKLNEELSVKTSTVEAQKKRLQELDLVKSHFFTNISHEFRTPLTIIRGMTKQLQKNPQKWLDKGSLMIIRNADNLLNLVNQILDLRTLESGSLKLNAVQGDIVYFINYVTESFQSMAESKKIALIFSSDKTTYLMDYDPEKITRICSNLLSNAIKFTVEGGKVKVGLEIEEISHPDNSEETPIDGNPQAFAILTISDTGIGISKDKLPHIFDRFYQVDSSTTRTKEGSGVGLTLTKELVNLMGGDIEVSSTIGEHTTFRVKIPVRHEAPTGELGRAPVSLAPLFKTTSPAPETDIQPPPSSEKNPRLMIVEDNPDIIHYLSSCLEDQYTLLIAKDGKEGIDLGLKEVPDLIISDVMMPQKDGYELCDTLKRDLRTSHIPIVLLTAKTNTESRLEGLRKGADAYLSKPFNQEELFIRLEKLLELRKKLQERYAQFSQEKPIKIKDMAQEDEFIMKIKQLIEKNMKEGTYGVQELCRDTGMSRSNLHRKITALTGNSISIYIRRVRLHQAKKLLLETQLTISEIAYDVGFSDPKYFTRSFKKEFGHTPSQMRQMRMQL